MFIFAGERHSQTNRDSGTRKTGKQSSQHRLVNTTKQLSSYSATGITYKLMVCATVCSVNVYVSFSYTLKKKDERPEERGWDAMQSNRNIGEKQDEMSRPLGKNGCKQTSKESRCGKTSRTQEKGKTAA